MTRVQSMDCAFLAFINAFLNICQYNGGMRGGGVMRLLVAEDERDMNRLLAEALKRAGYSVDCCYDGEEAWDYVQSAGYDAVLLDIMMPRLNGYEVLRRMREAGQETPVIFLTARGGLEDRVQGLDLGADDYLVKPFAMDELLARLRVVTRRRGGHPTNIYTAADLTLDVASHQVIRGGQTIELSAKEFALLECLLRNKGTVLSREQLLDSVWNFDYAGSANVVDVYISYLRRKIDGEHEHKLLQTIWGTGWVLKE